MSNERLIWRPSEVPMTQWEAMPREEQIRWWKDHQPPPPPKPHMKTAIRLYNRGEITEHEFCAFVAKIAAPEEIEEFVRECPLELMATLKEALSQYGPDESKWPQTFCMRSYFPWVTAEEIKESQRREQEQIWKGIRLLKEHLPTTGLACSGLLGCGCSPRKNMNMRKLGHRLGDQTKAAEYEAVDGEGRRTGERVWLLDDGTITEG